MYILDHIVISLFYSKNILTVVREEFCLACQDGNKKRKEKKNRAFRYIGEVTLCSKITTSSL